MRYLGHLVLLSLLILPVIPAHAGVAVGVAVGPGYVGAAPVCPYGYYGYYPYACAPYGYYGPSWFLGGVFIGAGPWYHGPGFYRPNPYARGWYGPGPYAHPGYGYYNHGGYAYHGPVARAQVGSGFRGGAGGFHGGVRR
jgi:hypothetical protein